MEKTESALKVKGEGEAGHEWWDEYQKVRRQSPDKLEMKEWGSETTSGNRDGASGILG